MSYELFCSKINAICGRAGLSARFSHEDGRHIARISDGSIITANTVSTSVCICDQYHNHMYQAAI